MTKTRKSKKPTSFEGLPIVDAAEDVSLVINRKDVTDSKKKDPSSCAAALAGRREFNTDVRVYLSRMYVRDKKQKRWIRFCTPNSVLKEIVAFDRGAAFEPGEYVFKAPPPSCRLGYKVTAHSNPGTGPKKKKARHMTANVRLSAMDKVTVGRAER